MAALSCSLPICAVSWTKTFGMETYLGPEVYGVERLKEGGVKQTGTLVGVRAGYDFIKRYRFYFGTDVLWAQGILNGKSQGNKIKSRLTDTNIEARLGYTIQSKHWRCASLTPYTGFGYFWENNHFEHPTPLPIHFNNRFSYVPFGFLSQIFLTPRLSIGLNVKFRYLISSEVFASHDPEQDDVTQKYNEKLQYRIEMPLDFFYCWRGTSLGLGLVPFYECRPYGKMANFPFDFLETRFHLYGATLKLLCLF